MTRSAADFDHLDPAVAARAHDVLRALRAECPVARSTRYGGFHVVTRHEDIATVGRDHARFSARAESIGAATLLPGLETAVAPLFEQDPPEHTEVRRRLAPYFSRAAVARLAPAIRATARSELAGLALRGGGDLVVEVARRIPPMVIAGVLGVAPPRRALLRDLLIGAVTEGRVVEYLDFLTEEVRLRRAAPGDDPLSAVVADRSVAEPDAVKYLLLMVAAGALTTIDATSSLLWLLSRDPSLADHPREALVDEVVRLEAPVATTARTVRCPTTLNGVELAEGDRLLVAWGSGSRDTEVYPDADAVRPDRAQGAGLAWGAGAHRCLGQHLARLELGVILDEVLAAIPGYRIPDGFEPEWTYGVLRGIRALPATWSYSDPASMSPSTSR
ncbi:cytochrome P450 [Actinokineospora sp. UTMC 2448]|uniref:cytochrome P450 n=1 Tax=Actinokineospora sp. UTMC 2448 TaxID=2268449 RepID=UPI002164DE06|nr:cytochrome P450 [Actinokineospora sp. UTMC 2448]UVS79940.1 Cytochrome P450 130 [Actinokineospora sp. UTMC 2448]